MNYGHFDELNKEYVITRPDTPSAWANYLGDPEYGAIISNNAGGYSFVKSGANGRVIRYRFNGVGTDTPGRYVYLRDLETNDYWSASWAPVCKPLDQFKSECRHGTAYTVITSEYKGVKSEVTAEMLKVISDYDSVTGFQGAYNIRQDSMCAGRKNSENITIESKTDKPGINIRVKPGTKGETVYIPACVTHSNVDDLVYNDFFIGEGADVTIVAGCGVHSDGSETARHNGIHRFFLEKGARVLYKEKHIGTGKGTGLRRIDPVTDAYLKENSYLEMDTVQLRGVDRTTRSTSAVLDKGAKIVVRERIMTDGDEDAVTKFKVELNGEDCGADVVSRSVARGNSHQAFYSVIEGNARCTGHSACDAILADNGRVDAQPALNAANVDAALIHEAAIGKIAGDQIMKLCSLGLTREEAEEKIIERFLK